ncbi:MAG TPA: hypothetical protein VH479_07115 [Acidimicrobiales bacterium]
MPEETHPEMPRPAVSAERERGAGSGRNAEVFRDAAARAGRRITRDEIVEALRSGREG